MNKTSVKVIKRKDAVTAEPEMASEPKAMLNQENVERRSRREMVNTVANWITERREKRRVEEVAAIRKIFGEPLLNQA